MSQSQAQLVGNVVTGAVFAGIVTATSANIGGGVVGINSTGINVVGVVTAVGGFNIGIQSAGNSVTTGVITAINFVGAGNTLQYNPSTKTVDISIAGGGGAIGTTGITTQTIFSNPNIINTPQLLTNPNHNYGVFGPISIASTITVGVGNTFVVV